jgi:phosphatidylserine synthase
MRLARFNLTSETPTGGWFVGVPITAVGGGMVSSLVIVMVRHQSEAETLPLHLYLPVIMFVFAILMISRLRFPKATKRESLLINAFQVVNISLIYYCGITRSWPEYLLIMGTFTMIAGIIAGRMTRQQS